MQDVDNTTQVFIDSDGNIVTRGCVRLDSGLTECTDAETLIVDGTLGVGVVSPAIRIPCGLECGIRHSYHDR